MKLVQLINHFSWIMFVLLVLMVLIIHLLLGFVYNVLLDLLMIIKLVNVLFLLIILCLFQHVLLEQHTIILPLNANVLLIEYLMMVICVNLVKPHVIGTKHQEYVKNVLMVLYIIWLLKNASLAQLKHQYKSTVFVNHAQLIVSMTLHIKYVFNVLLIQHITLPPKSASFHSPIPIPTPTPILVILPLQLPILQQPPQQILQPLQMSQLVQQSQHVKLELFMIQLLKHVFVQLVLILIKSNVWPVHHLTIGIVKILYVLFVLPDLSMFPNWNDARSVQQLPH